jgi:hypothetical protein
MSENYLKYLKYKNKYLELKELVGGGPELSSDEDKARKRRAQVEAETIKKRATCTKISTKERQYFSTLGRYIELKTRFNNHIISDRKIGNISQYDIFTALCDLQCPLKRCKGYASVRYLRNLISKLTNNKTFKITVSNSPATSTSPAYFTGTFSGELYNYPSTTNSVSITNGVIDVPKN